MTGSHSGPGGTAETTSEAPWLFANLLNHASVLGGTIHFVPIGTGNGAIYGKLVSISSG